MRTRRSIQETVRRSLELAAAADGLSAHSLRHSFATHLLDAGAALMAGKELLATRAIREDDGEVPTTRERLKQVYRDAHPRS